MNGDDPRLGHGVDGKRHALSADSRALAATVGHRVDPEVARIVDHHRANPKPLRDVKGGVEVASEDAILKSVLKLFTSLTTVSTE